MKWCFIIYWVFYLATWSLEYLINPMTIDWALSILTMYWLSFIFLAFVPIYYLYVDLEYKEVYIEGIMSCFIARSILQISSIYGYQDKRFDIAITGFVLLAWVAIGLKRKLKRIETNLL